MPFFKTINIFKKQSQPTADDNHPTFSVSNQQQLQVQVQSDGGNYQIEVYARLKPEFDFHKVQVLSDYTMKLAPDITQDGLYKVICDMYVQVQFRLISVSGKVDCYGITST